MNMQSVYFRLTLWYSALVIVVSLAFGAYTYRSVQEGLYVEIEQLFNNRIGYITRYILQETQDSEELTRRITALYSPESNSRFIRITHSENGVLYMSGSPKDGSFEPDQISSGTQQRKGRWIEKLARSHDMLMVAMPVTVDDELYFIEAGMPLGELDSTLKGLFAALLLGLPIMVLVVSAAGYILVRRALKPVDDMRAKAMQITFGNLSNRLPVAATGDSLEQLSITLNQMLERLEGAYEQLSRFSIDASHELRTPLTIVRGELESLISEKEEKLTPSLRERIGSVLEEAERLSHIVESLFAISRLDAGEANMHRSNVDLSHLVESTADQMMLLAEEKSIEVSMKFTKSVTVKGDMARLKQVVVNLLDNAIKYTPKKGTIFIEVGVQENLAIFSVTDNGIGIPADALPHVFERFYRADKMRSREMGGAGLGLSIVRSICTAHGGTVKISSSEGNGTTCRVELPVAETVANAA